MLRKSSSILISFVVITISCNFTSAACPSADLTGDCFVNFEDFAVMAAQWPATDPCVPDDMVYIPGGEFEMGNHFAEGDSDELPVHAVLIDSFFMGRYEVTNRQYCVYLNTAILAGDIKVVGGIVYDFNDTSNSYPYCDTHSYSTGSQIDYNDVSGTFSVREKSGRDMSNDPMVRVSWYGAAAYCNWRSQQEGYEACYNLSTWECDFSKKGYRLATEAEWEYAARGGEDEPYYRFPWGDTISHSQANYYAKPFTYSYDISPTTGYHPDWEARISPFTSVVGSFSANGYGLYDMAGNVQDWCNDWYNSAYYSTSPYDNPQGPVSGTYRVLRGGSWIIDANNCRVADRFYYYDPGARGYGGGFRVVLDLESGCPSADLTGDCSVDYVDFALMAAQWLTTDPCFPDDMVYIPDGEFEMGDHHDGMSNALPVHAVLLDAFFMSKFLVTNQQYCDYLNSTYPVQIKVDGGVVYAASDTSNNYPYCDTYGAGSDRLIDFSDPDFSVRTKDGRDMSDDPIVQVSWYGAVAYCNWRSSEEGYEACYNLSTWECDFSKNGYRLPTEAEREYAARSGQHSPYYRFPWGDTISHTQANYVAVPGYFSYDVSPTSDYHPLWNGVNPDTSPVGFFDGTMKYKDDYNWPGSATSYQTTSGANGCGLHDMAGNVWEWCNDWYASDYYDTSPYDNPTGPASGTARVARGGHWRNLADICLVAYRYNENPVIRNNYRGFRVVLDLN